MADGVVADLFGVRGLCICQVLAVGLESGDDVELREAFAGAWADGAAVDHDTGTVETADWRRVRRRGRGGGRED